MPAQIVRIRVFKMWETCQRTTFYVELTTDEGFTMTPVSHRTGSIYTNHEGLSIDEARERALSEAAEWADFLRLPVEPYVEEGVAYKPGFVLESYTTQRVLAERDTAKSAKA